MKQEHASRVQGIATRRVGSREAVARTDYKFIKRYILRCVSSLEGVPLPFGFTFDLAQQLEAFLERGTIEQREACAERGEKIVERWARWSAGRGSLVDLWWKEWKGAKEAKGWAD